MEELLGDVLAPYTESVQNVHRDLEIGDDLKIVHSTIAGNEKHENSHDRNDGFTKVCNETETTNAMTVVRV